MTYQSYLMGRVHDGDSALADDWHITALELFEFGFTQQQIADKCGVTQSRISRFLAHQEKPAFDEYVVMRQPRKIRQILNYKAMGDAIRAFAAYEIDRTELMRLITMPAAYASGMVRAQ